jgi:hypothetical protein
LVFCLQGQAAKYEALNYIFGTLRPHLSSYQYSLRCLSVKVKSCNCCERR